MSFFPRVCWLVMLLTGMVLHAGSFKFTATSLGGTIPGLEYQNGKKNETFVVPVFQRSRLMEYTGESPLVFFTVVEKDGKKERRKAGEVTLAREATRVLLVFHPRSDGAYDIQALDDSAASMPPGVARIYNASSVTLGAKCNKNIITLAPEAQKLIPANGRRLIMIVAYQQKDHWVRAASNVFETGPGIRQTIFLTATQDAIYRLNRPGETARNSSLEHTPVQMFSLAESVEPPAVADAPPPDGGPHR